jgi:hypothetical protein
VKGVRSVATGRFMNGAEMLFMPVPETVSVVLYSD